MALYRYVKKQNYYQGVERNRRKINPKIISLPLVLVGLFFLANAAYPILSYQLFVSPRFSRSFISPSSEAAIAQTFGTTTKSGEILGSEMDLLDFTKANNWYPEEKTSFLEDESKSYSLSIPKLKIVNAKVIMGNDLSKSLVHFPGTPPPGRFGNTVIFGHSVLPQFFNPNNYLTIFSTLPTLKPKDEIIIDYNQVEYKYVIEQMIEVSPEDISLLAQRYDDSYLTLITCVPPGTYLKRLIIRARLTKI